MKLLKIKSKHNTTYRNSDGKCHRDNDLPSVIWSDGEQWWYRDGKRHRDNGPAIIRSNGDKEWWVNGEFIKREKAT